MNLQELNSDINQGENEILALECFSIDIQLIKKKPYISLSFE